MQTIPLNTERAFQRVKRNYFSQIGEEDRIKKRWEWERKASIAIWSDEPDQVHLKESLIRAQDLILAPGLPFTAV